MAEIVNLRQARKRKRREEKETGAAENRSKFGRTKGDVRKSAFEKSKAEQRHDEHKLDD